MLYVVFVNFGGYFFFYFSCMVFGRWKLWIFIECLLWIRYYRIVFYILISYRRFFFLSRWGYMCWLWVVVILVVGIFWYILVLGSIYFIIWFFKYYNFFWLCLLLGVFGNFILVENIIGCFSFVVFLFLILDLFKNWR